MIFWWPPLRPPDNHLWQIKIDFLPLTHLSESNNNLRERSWWFHLWENFPGACNCLPSSRCIDPFKWKIYDWGKNYLQQHQTSAIKMTPPPKKNPHPPTFHICYHDSTSGTLWKALPKVRSYNSAREVGKIYVESTPSAFSAIYYPELSSCAIAS